MIKQELVYLVALHIESDVVIECTDTDIKYESISPIGAKYDLYHAIRSRIFEYDRFVYENGKVFEYEFGVVLINNILYGTVKLKLNKTKKLSKSELQAEFKLIEGQLSDGWGEGFNQQGIPYEGKKIYVDFYPEHTQFNLIEVAEVI